MKTMRKVICVLLAILICSTTCFMALAAEDRYMLSVKADKQSANVGDIVSTTIMLSSNSHVSSIAFDILYDTDSFEYQGDAKGGSFLNEHSALLDKNEKETDSGKLTIAVATGDSLYSDSEGEIMSASFKVLKPNGEIRIVLDTVSADDFDGTDVTENGQVENLTISCAHGADRTEQVVEEATHNSAGKKNILCGACGEVLGTETIPQIEHLFTDWKVTKPATCTTLGEEEGTCSCGAKTTRPTAEFGEHQYIEKAEKQYLVSPATCITRATYYKSCSVCGEPSSETFESGEVNTSNHVGDTYVVKQKEATCYEEGYTGDTKCSSCDATITPGKTIPKNAHNPANVWSTNDTHHWKECQTVGCGNIIDRAEHSGGEATCTEKAICSVCHVQYGNLNPDNHKNTEIRNATNPTCSQDGYSGDTWCVDCQKQIGTGHSIPSTGKHVDADGEWESNATQHFHTCACGVEFDQEDHKGGEATCSAKAICDVCKSEYGDLNSENHAGGTEIKDVVEATCTTDGYTGNTYCKDCGVKIQAGNVIPASHTLQKVDAKAATHDTDGNIEYYVCTVCGTYFSDAAAESEITYDDTVIEKGKHNYVTQYDDESHWQECECGSKTEPEKHTFGEWVITKEAIASETGSREKTCSVCGYQITEEIPVISESSSSGTGTTGDSQVNGKPNNAQMSSPQTGEGSSMILWVILFAISGTALTGMVLCKRKRVK